jgi:hypothetical protein
MRERDSRTFRAAFSLFALALLMVSVVGGVGLVAADADGQGNENEPGANATSATDATPETKGFTVAELSENGPLPASTADPSTRARGEWKSWWLVHTPVRPMANPANRNDRDYIGPETTVEREFIRLGTFRGWEPDGPTTVQVHVVVWDVERVTRQVNGTNQTVEKPANVTEKTVNVTLSGAGRPEEKIKLPEHHGEPRFVTVWIDEKPDKWRWVFRYSASKAAESVPLETRGGAAMWAFLWVGLPFVGTASAGVFGNRHVLKKAVRVPDAALLQLGFVSAVVAFFAGVVFYHGTLETLAFAPWSIGVVGGLVVSLVYLFVFGKEENEALAIQFSADNARARRDGTGVWKVPNQTFSLHERDDGTLVASRDGWLPMLARAWPFADVTAEVELDGSPEMMLKGDENSEYSDVFVVDPEQEEVIEKELESWSFSVPSVVSWPTDDDGNRRPLPSVAWGPIVATGAAAGAVYYAGVGLVQNTALAGLGVCLVFLVAVTKPNPATLKMNLAPFQYGSVLEAVIKHREEYDEVADSEHFQEKYYQERARSDAKRKRDNEREEKTVFGELNDELSGRSRRGHDGDRGDRPDSVPTANSGPEPERRSEEASADD